MMYIENEGAIFKGTSRSFPTHVRDHGIKDWIAYEGSVPKRIEWGYEITEDEALEWIAEAEGAAPRTVGEDMELDPWKYDGYDGPRDYPKPGAMAHLELRARKAAEAAAAKDEATAAGKKPAAYLDGA